MGFGIIGVRIKPLEDRFMMALLHWNTTVTFYEVTLLFTGEISIPYALLIDAGPTKVGHCG